MTGYNMPDGCTDQDFEDAHGEVQLAPNQELELEMLEKCIDKLEHIIKETQDNLCDGWDEERVFNVALNVIVRGDAIDDWLSDPEIIERES